MKNQNLLSPEELSKFIGVSTGTLAVWRCNKTYAIPYIKIGSLIRYKLDEVNEWINSRKVNNPSEYYD